MRRRERNKVESAEVSEMRVLDLVRALGDESMESERWKLQMGCSKRRTTMSDSASAYEFSKTSSSGTLNEPCLAFSHVCTAWKLFGVHNQMMRQRQFPKDIQMQLAGIITTTTDDISRISIFFWLSSLTLTVDEYTGDGKPSTVGRGRISILYDQYVEAEFATHEAYERAKSAKDVQLDRMRDRWKRSKEVGGKVLRLTYIVRQQRLTSSTGRT